MPPPANVRYQASASFPANATGVSPIAVNKQGGIYFISYNMGQLAVGVVDNSPTKFLPIWDSSLNTYSRVSFASLLSTLSSFLGGQHRITTSPYNVISTDRVLLCDFPGAGTINLPTSASRAGLPVTVKDVSGNASTNPITVVPPGAETIDGLASIAIVANMGAATFVPFNDGVGTGWFIAL